MAAKKPVPHEPKVPAPEPVAAPKTLSFQGHEFTMKVGASLPADIDRATPKVTALPFKAWFDAMPHAEKPEVFLPNSFWLVQRKVPADKLTPGYIRTKIRTVFNAWRDASPSHKAVDLKLYYRDSDYEGQGPGMSIFTQVIPPQG
jgi:hypothetical protein